MLKTFNESLIYAKLEIELANLVGSHATRIACLTNAKGWMRAALAEANAMRDRKRAGLCLKTLHWLRLAVRS